ncbi:hypothetical protein Tco_1078909 [Tanacetum coccineum]|uniref:Uncharacterized protein n=1 Tax=Tanacetum coccineum TaxID=301880 RepID=A0ABQ5HR94_9ASTR
MKELVLHQRFRMRKKDKSEALDDLDDWGSTNDETFLFDDKDEKAEYIMWVSIDEDESDDNDEKDDESIVIEKTDDEKTDTDVEDQVIGIAEMIVAEKVEKEKADEEIDVYTAITKAGTKLLLHRVHFSCSWDTLGISTLKASAADT